MAKIESRRDGDTLILRVSGVVDEETKFENVSEPHPKSVIVECSGIRRLNSVGIKSWIAFFEGVAATGARIFFKNCPVSVVQQFNAISNFGATGSIVSLFVPFYCESCDEVTQALYESRAIEEKYPSPPVRTCPSCGNKAELDDSPEEYFTFIRRKLKRER